MEDLTPAVLRLASALHLCYAKVRGTCATLTPAKEESTDAQEG